jgi:hypothetical protein
MKENEEEDREEGIGESSYRCELCGFKDFLDAAPDKAGGVPDMWRRIQEKEQESYRKISAKQRYDLIANSFNTTIFDQNQRRPSQRMPLRKLTRAMVRHHMTQCNRTVPERALDMDIDLCDSIIKDIRYNGLRKRKMVNGEAQEAEIERGALERVLKTMAMKGSLLKLRESLGQSKQKLVVTATRSRRPEAPIWNK